MLPLSMQKTVCVATPFIFVFCPLGVPKCWVGACLACGSPIAQWACGTVLDRTRSRWLLPPDNAWTRGQQSLFVCSSLPSALKGPMYVQYKDVEVENGKHSCRLGTPFGQPLSFPFVKFFVVHVPFAPLDIRPF